MKYLLPLAVILLSLFSVSCDKGLEIESPEKYLELKDEFTESEWVQIQTMSIDEVADFIIEKYKKGKGAKSDLLGLIFWNCHYVVDKGAYPTVRDCIIDEITSRIN